MGAASLLYLLATQTGDMPLPLTLIPQQLIGGVDSFPLLAVPMFLLAGELMTRGGVTARLVNFAGVLVGHIRGGLAQVSIVTNVIMAGMSGSAVADAASTGSVLIPGMVKRGYTPEYAAAVIAAAACIGPIIPPSLMFVVLGSMVNVSVGQLFAAGIIPGLLMALAMMAVVYRQALKKGLPVEPRATLPGFWKATREALLALGMPVIILGAILSGIATPTEASVVAVVYALVLGVFVYREIKPRDLLPILKKSAISSSVILFIIANAGLFAFMITRAGVPDAIGQYLTSVLDSPLLFLVGINIALFLIGMFIETSASIIVLAPILVPVAVHFGIDPIHFGMIMVVNLALGMITPPFGVNLFAACTVARISYDKIVPAVLPFVGVVMLCLAVITFVPQISLFLRDLVYR
jgi:tripartite ATP-independent transporter DctM subunit